MTADDEARDRRAAKLSALLRATDAPVPPLAFPAERIAARRRRRTVQRWAVAAGLVVALTGATLVEPVRAWIAGTARALFSGREPAAAAPAAPTAAASPSSASTVTFQPGEGTLTIEVASRQAAGLLRVRRTDGVDATAAIVGDAADAELLVQPGVLRIVNRRGAAADYEVRVPALVRAVVLRVAGDPVRRFEPSAGGETVVPLGGPDTVH